jgi:hypothetical protein
MHCTALLELRMPCNVGGLQQRMLGLRLIIGLQTQFPLRFHTRVLIRAATFGS